VHGPLEVAQQLGQAIWRRGHEGGVAGPGAPDPVLGPPHLAGLLAASTCPLEQAAVGLRQQAHRERQPVLARNLRPGPLQRIQVAADHPQVRVGGWATRGLRLQQVQEGDLRPLDRRGEHSLLADEDAHEPLDRGHHGAGELQALQGLLGASEQLKERRVRATGGSAGGRGKDTAATASSRSPTR